MDGCNLFMTMVTNQKPKLLIKNRRKDISRKYWKEAVSQERKY